MPNPPVSQENTIPSSTNPSGSDSSKGVPSTATSSGNTYSDFFDTTSTGSTQNQKPKKTPLEILTNILGYIISILVFLVIIGSIHVAFRTQERNTIAENYPFLCPYFNYDVGRIPGV